MLARYPSVCRVCGQTINKGDPIGQRDIQSPRGAVPVKRYVHEKCMDASVVTVTPPTPTVPAPSTGNPLVDAVQSIVDTRLSERMDDVDARIQEVVQALPTGGGRPPVTVQVLPPLTPREEITGARHSVHAQVLSMIGAGLPVFLVGPAGSGKSTLARQVAEDLNLPFHDVSCSETMSESKLIGRIAPNAAGGCEFQSTPFLDAYENGGLFLLDEVDASNPNVLVVLHSAIANGHLSLPHRVGNPVAKKHDKFRLILSGNTFGLGADAQYVGRNQLDAATLDRVALSTVYMDYDTDLEHALCPSKPVREWASKVRAQINEHKVRRILSTRTLVHANTMQTVAGWTLEQVKERYFATWTPAEKAKVQS